MLAAAQNQTQTPPRTGQAGQKTEAESRIARRTQPWKWWLNPDTARSWGSPKRRAPDRGDLPGAVPGPAGELPRAEKLEPVLASIIKESTADVSASRRWSNASRSCTPSADAGGDALQDGAGAHPRPAGQTRGVHEAPRREQPEALEREERPPALTRRHEDTERTFRHSRSTHLEGIFVSKTATSLPHGGHPSGRRFCRARGGAGAIAPTTSRRSFSRR